MMVPVRRMALSPIVVPGYAVFPKNSRDGKPRKPAQISVHFYRFYYFRIFGSLIT